MANNSRKFKAEKIQYDPKADAKGGFIYTKPNGQPGVTVPGGHYIEMRGYQQGIRNSLKQWNKLNCNKCATKIQKAIVKDAISVASENVEIPPGMNFIPINTK